MRLSVPFLVFAVLVGGVESQQATNVTTTAANAAALSPSPPASAPVGAANDEDENDSSPTQGSDNSSSSSSAPANSTVAATPAAAPVAASASNVDGDGTLAATYAPTPLIETETPTAAPFFHAPRECYDKLQIVHDMIKVQEPFMQHVYKLCPNTIFDIGTIDENHECCIQGDARLVPRKDTTIQCGEDGLSTNNCTLRGGPVQVISWDENYNLEAKTNTALKGLTFESTDQISILLMTGGEFLFEDCIFQNHTGLGSIKLANDVRRRLSKSMETVEHESSTRSYEQWTDAVAMEDGSGHHNANGRGRKRRQLQTEAPRQKVTFNNCLFQYNAPGLQSEMTHHGIIFAEYAGTDVIVNNSLFLDNAFDTVDVVGDSFAIHVVTGSTLEIHNTCFLGNNFKGRGAILADEAESVLAQSGNYATNDPNLDCQFINVGDEACVEFNSPTCLADRYREMTGATTPPTTTEPTQSNEPNATQPESGSSALEASIGRVAMMLVVVVSTML